MYYLFIVEERKDELVLQFGIFIPFAQFFSGQCKIVRLENKSVVIDWFYKKWEKKELEK
jgi:hypothetical protein